MRFDKFLVESYMTLHEGDCTYNLTDTCVSSLTIREIEEITGASIIDALASIRFDYGPITGSLALKQAILSLYQEGTPDNIAVTHGVNNGNEIVMMALLSPGDHIITMTPTYQQFYTLPEMLGCTYTLVPLDETQGWRLDLKKVEEAINAHTKMIILNSPNNPTGTLVHDEDLEALIALAREKHIYILNDGVYRGLHPGLTSEISDLYELGIDTCGLSKVYSFAGIRVGWIKADEGIIARINDLRDYTIVSIGPFADYLACVLLAHREAIIARSNHIVDANKQIFREFLAKNKRFSCVVPEDGSVAFMKYHFDIDSTTFCEKLQKETGIFFVPGACFYHEHHVRIGFTNDPAITKVGLEKLSAWLDDQGIESCER